MAGVQLPLDARVLLAGDHTVWDPGGGDAGRALWTHLRLMFCRAVWHLRCHRVATGKVFTAAAVVGLTAAWVERAIRLDWLRVVADLTRAHTLPSWCIIHKRFNMSQVDFSKRWCLGDVLAQVSSDETGLPAVCVHVPTALPVPACCFGGGCCFGGAGGGTLDSRLSRFLFAPLYMWGLGGGGCATAALPLLSLVLLLCCTVTALFSE